MSTFTFKLRDFLPLLALVCVLYARSGWLKLACSEEIGSFCPLSCRQAFFFFFFCLFTSCLGAVVTQCEDCRRDCFSNYDMKTVYMGLEKSIEEWGRGERLKGGNKQWGTTNAEMKAPSVENSQPSKVLPLNPGAGQNIARHASTTAKNSSLPIFYFSGPFNFICSNSLSIFFQRFCVDNTVS